MAKGSAPWSADWQPRDCYVCGERVLKAGEAAGSCMDDQTGAVYVWHFRCAAGPPPGRGHVGTRSGVAA